MAFETTAFDLTAEEKHATLGEIRCLVLGTGALIARAKKYKSPHDYAEALSSINRALTLATDADACDPSLAPLATCYLYKGHILLGLKLEKDAHEAYAKAAATETREFTDATAPRDEAKRILRYWDRTKVSKRNEKRPAVQDADARFILSLPGKGSPASRF
ncbi:hypothetical protein E0Z10_g257 [Xylaria hypoxylon]|uniref:Uncharacterized protein n=1 Tax=Xylaria hypoxylon TaxID=37992 RepID=A0A4Z0ZA64_9PEZI|nr:hypothetical protein E0Z10_g257 [Xylaria hypoxylon]